MLKVGFYAKYSTGDTFIDADVTRQVKKQIDF
jgi:hypothetical protein